jgi:hypothetical protein
MRFAHIEDVGAHYQAMEATALYKRVINPNDRPVPRPKRKRNPSLRSMLAMSARAGVSVASYTIGGITINVGKPPLANGNSSADVRDISDAPAMANDWDTL